MEFVVRTRDEHCEPHVHVYHLGQGWELRIFFSYISPQVTGIELRHGRVPARSMVQIVISKVTRHLDKARELFWRAAHTVCLDNRYVLVVAGVVRAAQRETAGAVRIRVARYIPSDRTLEFSVHGDAGVLLARCP